MTPIANADEMSQEELLCCMKANFDRALGRSVLRQRRHSLGGFRASAAHATPVPVSLSVQPGQSGSEELWEYVLERVSFGLARSD